MNDTDKLLMMKEREDEGNYVKKKKVQYVTRPHASTVEVTIHNLKPEQPPNCSVLTSNGFACINVTLHIKVFSVRVQLFLFASCFMWQESEGGRTHPRAHHPEHKRRKKHQPRAKHLHFKCYSLSRFVFKQQSGLEKTQFCTLQLIYQTHTQDQKLAPEFVAGLIVCLHTQSHPKGPF